MTTRGRALVALQYYEAALIKGKADTSAIRAMRDYCYLPLGEYGKAIGDLNALIKQAPRFGDALLVRAIAHARLGHRDEARADLAQYEKGDSVQRFKLYLAVVVAAELGEPAGPAFDKLEAALKTQPNDLGLAYLAARAYAVASHAIASKDEPKRRSLADRAIGLLKKATENGLLWYTAMTDFDLDLIRDMPQFSQIIKAGHLDRLYSAAWGGENLFDGHAVYGLDPLAQLQQCRELASQGYRMVSLAAARISPDAPPVTASVWHRPTVSEQAKDQLAERQARAAIALLRMDRAEEVWPLLRHSPDPRLRSFVINWLNPLGADANVVVAELDRIAWRGSPDPGIVGREAGARLSPRPAERGEGGRRPGEGNSTPGAEGTKAVGRIANPSHGPGERPSSQLMDAILFHPETSIRRALILALGTYGPDALSPGEREPLAGKLLDLYKNDPDSGIHGAAEWTLRQWNKQAKLKAALAELPSLKDRGDRRWFVNSQGQTFTLIDGPVEFTMGSPPTEPDRNAGYGHELPHRRIIPRRFAIAAKEVTVEQYWEFVKENPGFADITSDQYTPYREGPANSVSWYVAAAYCDWLSRKENLPECYEPNDRGQYAVGMKSRADALSRTGYRMATEAEWEYACRAGAITSRYYGHTTELLGKYAWYQATSQDHLWPCGSLLPNDLGLFDMLGNAYEYCHDCCHGNRGNYLPDGEGRITDHTNVEEFADTDRLLRGGAFYSLPSAARSANRNWFTPAIRLSSFGFRLARTCN